MEHIVQFGITIDDEVIKQTICENAQRELIKELKRDAMCQLLGKGNPENVTTWDKKHSEYYLWRNSKLL